MNSTEKLICSFGLLLTVIFGTLLHDKISNPEIITRSNAYYDQALLNQYYEISRKKKNIKDLKKIIETKEFVAEMFKDTPPEVIYFGNLTVGPESSVSLNNALFICIGDFEYGISLGYGSSFNGGNVWIESK